ncbi:DUF309 domain-containing protein [Paenibacillus sp. LHD-117]|uniref:DUF309 domain-containing protein n=1 Tax=Paenibacillus sp. LHD-117 TaxID=3071412 RepID=UPI0027DFE0ED|nr:DUF309 domain-containing protein [Paenibacillus sp. LHD-117]MDQ6418132.1 DUF309 domain-containing protein [Paenibacillus sp. LHD-117]
MRPYPEPYIAYLVEFHATRDYFECHELLEEYWKDHLDDGLADLWVGLIQLAVGQYHERRGNRRGAGRMYAESLKRLSSVDWSGTGLRQDDLLKQLRIRLAAVNEEGESPYRDMRFIIEDDELMRICEVECQKLGVVWGAASPMDNDAVIHRHKLRDRSVVIAARAAALAEKRAGREK